MERSSIGLRSQSDPGLCLARISQGRGGSVALAFLPVLLVLITQNSTRNINCSFRGLLDPLILPNVAGVEIFADGGFRIAWLNRLNASARKLALQDSMHF